MRLTLIGVGGLGGALATALCDREELTLCVRRAETAAHFTGRAAVTTELQAAVSGAEVVVLCVKPKDTPALAAQLSDHVDADALLVSCAAGVSLSALTRSVASRVAVARAMPNIGAAVGASTTAYVLGAGCVAARDAARVERIFTSCGEVRAVKEEAWLHPITAVAASGPAFLLLAVEALVDAAVEQGLPRGDALAYARGALRAAALRLGPDTEPSTLRTQVTSPAGTTAAGLARLESAGVRAAFLEAVRAATARSRELSDG